MDFSLSPELDRQIVELFIDAGYDPRHAQQVPGILAETIFNIHVHQDATMNDATWLVALSYGGRHDTLGNVSIPGPQNESLAAVVVRHYKKQPRPVFAQREIGLLLKERISAKDLWISGLKIEPLSGRAEHYSTQEVLTDILSAAKEGGVHFEGSVVGLIAHDYHLPRVATIARRLGINKIACPPHRELPQHFDPQCYAPWARDFRGAFLSNAISSLAFVRNEEYCKSPQYFLEE